MIGDSVLWNVDEQPRFPVTPVDWESVSHLPELPPAQVVGSHGYDLVINPKARKPALGTMARLLRTFRSDFRKATDLLDAVQWRFLFYLDLYPWAKLGNPCFDGRQVFHDLLDQEAPATDVRIEWTGADQTASEILWEIQTRISTMEPDVIKAVWAILAFSRGLGLRKNEVLQCPWWTTWWIARCVETGR